MNTPITTGPQIRPALRMAVGQLDANDQGLIQISMRILAARLRVPCTVIPASTGDITLTPCNVHSGLVCLATAHKKTHLERPLRLIPLSDALSELIDDLLVHEGTAPAEPMAESAPVSEPVSEPTPAAASAAIAVDTPASAASAPVAEAPRNARSLLECVLGRSQPGPVLLRLRSGVELVIDLHYRSAWLTRPPEALQATLASDPVVWQEQMSALDFQRQTRIDTPLHPILLEQLCWMSDTSPGAAAHVERWHEDTTAHLLIDTWPNLSAQPDMLAWLETLALLADKPMFLADAVRIAQGNGISHDRARFGIAMLLSFRHASLRTPLAHFAPPQIPLARSTTPPAPRGLLAQLRQRLRNLMG